MSSSIFKTGLSLPALRGHQGDRVMYLVLPTNNVLNTFFTTEMEPVDDRAQRPLDPKHARDIGDYITRNPAEYLLGAITYAVDVPGDFEEVEAGSGIGLLHLPLTARLRSVDGQHRRQGIKEAIDVVTQVGEDNTALLIYVESDLAHRKQMFSDMNNTPRVVSKAINVGFDSRDPFARAANRLVAEHPLLRGRVETTAARTRPGSDALYTLGAIHDAAKRLFVGTTGRVRDPDKYTEDEIVVRATALFDLLARSRPEFAQAVDAESLDALRTRSILFSSTTLRVIAGAVSTVIARDGVEAITDLDEDLRDVDFGPAAPIWVNAGFVSPGKTTPNARNQEVLAATQALVSALQR